jgi:hypothetical protein
MSDALGQGAPTYTSLFVEALTRQRDHALNLLAQTQAQLALTDAENARLRVALSRGMGTHTTSAEATPYPA